MIWDENTWLIPSGIEKSERKKHERKMEIPLDSDLSEYAKRMIQKRIMNNLYTLADLEGKFTFTTQSNLSWIDDSILDQDTFEKKHLAYLDTRFKAMMYKQ